MNLSHIAKLPLLLLVLLTGLSGCTLSSDDIGPVLDLPFIKNTPRECYYLDEFMPVPDRLVSGRTGGLGLRYYSYNFASYKDWQRKKITLSFYSNDDLCWHLFEEYYEAD